MGVDTVLVFVSHAQDRGNGARGRAAVEPPHQARAEGSSAWLAGRFSCPGGISALWMWLGSGCGAGFHGSGAWCGVVAGRRGPGRACRRANALAGDHIGPEPVAGEAEVAAAAGGDELGCGGEQPQPQVLGLLSACGAAQGGHRCRGRFGYSLALRGVVQWRVAQPGVALGRRGCGPWPERVRSRSSEPRQVGSWWTWRPVETGSGSAPEQWGWSRFRWEGKPLCPASAT